LALISSFIFYSMTERIRFDVFTVNFYFVLLHVVMTAKCRNSCNHLLLVAGICNNIQLNIHGCSLLTIIVSVSRVQPHS
jgi:hypothetical protein